MHLRPVDYIFWLSAPIMQLGVLIAMYRRGIHRDYPCFFNYTILQVFSEPILYVLGRQSYGLYYVGYWTSVGLSVLFSFAVLQEIFRNAFRPYEALRDLSVILFRWSALVILLVAAMWAMTSGHSDQGDAVKTTVFLVERSVRLMQCGLVFFLFLFSEYLGISRKNILFGIAIGFGLFASVSMLVAAGTSHASLSVLNLRWAKSAAYNLACFIWLGYTLLAPVRSSVAAATQRSKDWNYALEDVRVQPVPDSLLDSMDRTVERLLYPPEEVKANVTVGHH
jgi:hypothetical protein